MTEVLRTASARDVALMAVVHARSFGVEAWSAAQLEGSLGLATTQSLCLWIDERLVAFILVQRLEAEAEILTVCVDPDFRRRGYARRLLEPILLERQQDTVFLEVAEDNLAAIGLYESCGFRVLGRRPAYYKRETGAADALTYRYLVNA